MSHSSFVLPFEAHAPSLHPTSFAAPGSTLIGDVIVGEESSIWYGAVLRGDVGAIRVGRRSNIQDGSVVHCTTDLSTCVIEDEVTVGHRVVLHGCLIRSRVLVGMGSVVLDLAEIGEGSVLAAGSLVTPRTVLPGGYLCMGSPARAMRPLNEKEKCMIDAGWMSYVEMAVRHVRALAAFDR